MILATRALIQYSNFATIRAVPTTSRTHRSCTLDDALKIAARITNSQYSDSSVLFMPIKNKMQVLYPAKRAHECVLDIDVSFCWHSTRQVSSTELCRAELESLQSKVDERLTNLQARPGPVCAVREEMFSELYDEVIREVKHRRDSVPK